MNKPTPVVSMRKIRYILLICALNNTSQNIFGSQEWAALIPYGLAIYFAVLTSKNNRKKQQQRENRLTTLGYAEQESKKLSEKMGDRSIDNLEVLVESKLFSNKDALRYVTEFPDPATIYALRESAREGKLAEYLRALAEQQTHKKILKKQS